MSKVAKFSVVHAKDNPFQKKGLRDYFEYRDLGIREATGGRFHAHAARAVRPCNEKTGRHVHNLEMQFIYITKGWLRAEYEGIGEVEFVAGSCLHNPPGNPHEVTGFSDDLEFIELTAPADYDTVEV